MPSERFFKLKADKQERILEASIDEFSEVGYRDASINQIIKDADISRGSFYTYFADKQDLFGMLLSKFKDSAVNAIVGEVKKNHGDIFQTCRNLMHSAVTFSIGGGERTMRFYYRMMTDPEIMNSFRDHSFFQDMLRQIYRNMDNLKEHLTESDFTRIADMLTVLSIKTLVIVQQKREKTEELMNMLFYQYDIIERGIRGGSEK